MKTFQVISAKYITDQYARLHTATREKHCNVHIPAASEPVSELS